MQVCGMTAINGFHCTTTKKNLSQVSISFGQNLAYSFKVDHPVWGDGGGEVGRGGDVEEVEVCGEDEALLGPHQVLVDYICLLHW